MEEKSTFEGKGVKGVANYYLTHIKSRKGITLIALAITIIVLLILASVTISLLLGDNNIFQVAGWAEYLNEYETVNERVEIYVAGNYINHFAKKETEVASLGEIGIKTEEELKNMYPTTNKININSVPATLRQTIKRIEGLRTKDLTDETLVNLYKVDLNSIKTTTKRQYVVNIVSGELYSLEYHKYRGKLYHTPREGVKKNFIEVVPNIDESGKYEIYVDAGMIVEWDSIVISYGRYIQDSVSVKVYTSEDDNTWVEENINLESDDTIEQIYNLSELNKTQYLKAKIDVSEINGKSAEIDYILVNFYKYKALEGEPTVQKTGVDEVGDIYLVPTRNGQTNTGTVTQTITIPNDSGNYIIDLGSLIGNPTSTVTITSGGTDTTYTVKSSSEFRNLQITPGAIVQIVTPLNEGEGIGKLKVLKKDTEKSNKKVEEIEEIQEKRWITVASKRYAYNNGGSGWWQKCLINDVLVGKNGIIEQGETNRIRVTYEVSEDGRTWSEKFTNIQDAEHARYLKVNVEYQAVEGTNYNGDITNSKIKIILSDGTWTIDFKDTDGSLIYTKRAYYLNSDNKRGTIEIPNYLKVNEEDNTEFYSWIGTPGEYIPGQTFIATDDEEFTAKYITPTIQLEEIDTKQYETELKITTNYRDEMIEKYVYYVSGKEPKDETSKTPTITELSAETTYTIYAKAYSKAGNIITSNTITINTLEDEPPEDADISFDKTVVNENETIQATIKLLDKKSGINMSNSRYIVALNQSTKYGENAQIWSTNTAKTFETTDTTQTINITESTRGYYYVHVLNVDNMGNKKETVSERIFFKGKLYLLNINGESPDDFFKNYGSWNISSGGKNHTWYRTTGHCVSSFTMDFTGFSEVVVSIKMQGPNYWSEPAKIAVMRMGLGITTDPDEFVYYDDYNCRGETSCTLNIPNIDTSKEYYVKVKCISTANWESTGFYYNWRVYGVD